MGETAYEWTVAESRDADVKLLKTVAGVDAESAASVTDRLMAAAAVVAVVGAREAALVAEGEEKNAHSPMS